MIMHRLAIGFVLATIVGYLFGCSHLQLERPLRPTPDDWSTYGGNAARSNVARDVIVPPLSPVWEHDASAGFSPFSAAVVDSTVFVGDLHGDVEAINIVTGRRLGVRNFGGAIVGTPTFDYSTMFGTLDNQDESIFAYDVRDGTFQWRVRLGDIASSPLLIGQHLYVTTLAGKLVCLEAYDGTTVWTYEIPAHPYAEHVHSSPASDGNTIVFGSDGGTIYAVSVDSGKLRWTASARASVFASPSIAEGKVFVGSLDSTFYALDIATGKQVWAQPLGARIYGSQAVENDRVFVGTAGRMVYCLNATNGEVIWKTAMQGMVNSSPLVSGGVVYVGCMDKSLYALDAVTGEVRWQFETDGRIKTMPIASLDHLIVLTEDHSVIALKHSDKQ
jgi:outer membrane protein assembly factor BamB